MISDDSNNIKHLAIIMDGNRRFARRLMLEPWRGHEWGAKKVEDILSWARDFGIKILTLYCLSFENFRNRPKNELDALFRIMETEFSKKETIEKMNKNSVRANIIGRTDLLPEKLQKILENISGATKNNSEYVVNFALVYGGRKEIADAAKAIACEVKKGALNPEKIDEALFSKYIHTKGIPDPDLIIRTGGEKRISGFLLWQSAYSELYFSDKLWPDFGKEDLKCALEDFKTRKRRFGK